MPKPLSVCVLGAGVIGLHVADRLCQDFPAAQLSVWAAGFYDETTSIGAAGLFKPGVFLTASGQITDQILRDSWLYYTSLEKSSDARIAGVRTANVLSLNSNRDRYVDNECLRRLAGDYRAANVDELNSVSGGPWRHGFTCTSLVVDSNYHLKWLLQRLKSRGVTILRRIVKSVDELKHFDAVISCSGLGSQLLFNDKKLLPIRGQVFKVRAPWIKRVLICDEDTYIIPGIDHVTLGGCRNFNSYCTRVQKNDSADIWERCVSVEPSLQQAQVIEQWVGLRPYRDPVRLEKQLLDSGTIVVHCYGHGGYGVTSAPGSAIFASRMLEEALRGDFSNPAISKL